MKIGQRTIKTCIALIISLGIFLILMLLNRILGFNEPYSYYVTSNEQWYVPTNFYTPFFAGIAVCYAMQQSYEQSKAQAKLRSIGSIIGGYWGFVVLVAFNALNAYILHFTKGTIHYNFVLYALTIAGVIPLMKIVEKTKTGYAGFITCLTYLSVTISVRNGGLGPFLFTNNRVISTIIGVELALYVNSFPHFTPKNKNILFISGMDGVLYSNQVKVSPQNVNVIRDICATTDMNLTFMSSRTAHYITHSLKPAELKDPIIVMNGCALYHPQTKTYTDVCTIDNDLRIKLDDYLKENNIDAFSFVYYENDFHCYYSSLKNEGCRVYFENNKDTGLKMTKGIVPSDELISMYLIVDTHEKIDELENRLNKYDNLIVYKYPLRFNENYSILRIMSTDAGKANAIKKLKQYINYDYVVCIAGRTYDEDAFDIADYKVCLNVAKDNIKAKADYIMPTDKSNKVLDFVRDVYHAKDYKSYLEVLKNNKN